VNLDIRWTEAERLASIELSLLRKLMARAPQNTINLALGELGFKFPQVLADKAIELMQNGQPRYSPNAGVDVLRERIAQDYSASGENICVCNGAEEALYTTIHSLVNPGDRIAIPDPDYPAYPVLAKLAGAEVIRLPFEQDLCSIDWDLWEKKLQGVKAILMSSPSNPSGYCLNRGDAQQLNETLNNLGITLILDEIYREIYIQQPDKIDYSMFDRLIRIGGVSKSHLMSGWRIGWLFASKPFITSAIKLKQYISTCPAWLSQYLALYALDCPHISLSVRDRMNQNHALVKNALSHKRMHIPTATPYILIHCDEADKQVETWLQKGLLSSPGKAYGFVTKDWIRLNYAVEKETLERAIRILL